MTESQELAVINYIDQQIQEKDLPRPELAGELLVEPSDRQLLLSSWYEDEEKYIFQGEEVEIPEEEIVLVISWRIQFCWIGPRSGRERRPEIVGYFCSKAKKLTK